MNNKYDIGNFAKLLERFTPDTELQMIDSFQTGENPFVPFVKNSKFEFVPYEPQESVININQLTEEYLRQPPKKVVDLLDLKLSKSELGNIAQHCIAKARCDG